MGLNKMTEALAKLQNEYPDLYARWVEYCKWHDREPDELGLTILRLWLERRHPDFLMLLDNN